jgi:predicted adenylyl cyclase CyaB
MRSSGTELAGATAHQELELKAVVPDVEGLIRRLLAAGATLIFRGTMDDRRYDRGNDLTSRDEVLRTRLLVSDSGSRESVLGWKGPTRLSPAGYKLREELEYPVEKGVSVDPLLLALGYSVVHSIHRRIAMYQLGDATVRVEHYPRMDVLVEVEGAADAIEHAIVISGIPRDQFMADSLSEFVTRFEQRTGLEAQVARVNDFK